MLQKIRLTEEDLRYIVAEATLRVLNESEIEEGKFARALGAAALGAGLLMGNPTNANAQLNIKSQVVEQPQCLMRMSTAGVFLYKESDGFRIRLFSKGLEQTERTMRQYSKGIGPITNIIGGVAYQQSERNVGKGYLSLFLGADQASAVKTLKQLAGLISNSTHKVEVGQTDGDVTLTNNTSDMFPDGLWVQQQGVDGYNLLTKSDIGYALEYFGDTYYMEQDILPPEVEKLSKEYNNLKRNYDYAAEEISNSDDEQFVSIKKQQRKQIKNRMSQIENTLWGMGYRINQ
jgi:hypothetical protein